MAKCRVSRLLPATDAHCKHAPAETALGSDDSTAYGRLLMETDIQPRDRLGGYDLRYERYRWQIFFITWLAYAGFYLTRKSFAVAKIELAKPEVMGISTAEMAWIDGSYLVTYAMGQFLWGICGDRFGTRPVILTGMLASVVTAAAMGASSLVVLLGVLLCLQGVCQSTGWAPLTKNIGNFFSQGERGRVMGFWCTNYALGGVMASALAGWSIEWVGQQRLLEYQPDKHPSYEAVVKVTASQGRDKQTALTIYGFLQMAETTRLPVAEAAGKFDARLKDEQTSSAVRAAALSALYALEDPRFDAALKFASASKDNVLIQAAKLLDDKIQKEKTPQNRLRQDQNQTWEDQKKVLATIEQTARGSIEGMLGWRHAFWVPAAVLLGIWGLFLVLQRNRPEDVGLPPIEEYHGEQEAVLDERETSDEQPEGSWTVFREVLTNRMVLLLAAVYFFLKPTRYLVLFWSPFYINERLGTGAASSGILGSMFDLAGPISVLFGGYMSDKVFGSRRMPMSVLSLIGTSVLLFFFPYLPDTKLSLGLGFFGIGFLLYIPDSLVSATAAIDFGTKKGASTATGMINGFGSIGAIAGGTMRGWVEDFHVIFVILSVSTMIAACLLLPKWNALPATVDRDNAAGHKSLLFKK